MARSFRETLLQPVDGAVLGLFRLVFGSVLVWEVARYFYLNRISAYYIKPALTFPFDFVPWLEPLSATGMYAVYSVMGAAALCMAIGLFFRAAVATFFLTYTYTFLLDQVFYNNHYYLICLLSFLLFFTRANRRFSVDALYARQPMPREVPFWNVIILRLQFCLVYFYGGVAKLNGDWFDGEPLRTWLRAGDPMAAAEGLPEPFQGWLKVFLVADWSPHFMAWSGCLLDLSVPFLLIIPRTRLIGFLMIMPFHLMNMFLFKIGVFPLMMILTSIIFVSPDTVRRWTDRLMPRFFHRTAADTDEAVPVTPAVASRGAKWVLPLLAAYLAIQVAVPLRHFVYPGNPSWTEEGHLFAWRMRLRTKKGFIHFQVTDPNSGLSRVIEPAGQVGGLRARKMADRPSMILQYAHFLRDDFARRGLPDVEVRAWAMVSLNGREPQPYVDHTVDLAKVPRSAFSHCDWVLPLLDDPPGPTAKNGADGNTALE